MTGPVQHDDSWVAVVCTAPEPLAALAVPVTADALPFAPLALARLAMALESGFIVALLAPDRDLAQQAAEILRLATMPAEGRA